MNKNHYPPGFLPSDIEGERKTRYMRRRFSSLHEQEDRPGYRERQSKRFEVLRRVMAGVVS